MDKVKVEYQEVNTLTTHESVRLNAESVDEETKQLCMKTVLVYIKQEPGLVKTEPTEEQNRQVPHAYCISVPQREQEQNEVFIQVRISWFSITIIMFLFSI